MNKFLCIVKTSATSKAEIAAGHTTVFNSCKQKIYHTARAGIFVHLSVSASHIKQNVWRQTLFQSSSIASNSKNVLTRSDSAHFLPAANLYRKDPNLSRLSARSNTRWPVILLDL